MSHRKRIIFKKGQKVKIISAPFFSYTDILGKIFTVKRKAVVYKVYTKQDGWHYLDNQGVYINNDFPAYIYAGSLKKV